MRWLLALLALVGLAGAAPAPRDWTLVTSRTAAGAFVIGNPAARVKLVEFVSYTCPHCAHFVVTSKPVLQDQWVRSGSTSIEVRHAIHDPFDLAAALLARCSGARFGAVTDAIYAQQADWYGKGAEFADANQSRLNLYPVLGRLRALADGAGLTGIARTTGGLSPAAVDACFATDTDLNVVTAMASAANDQIRGTPSFLLNGKLIENVSWEALSPQLSAAGAR